MKDVRRLTGLEPAQVLRRSDTQKLASIDESGVREELVRVPVELLIEAGGLSRSLRRMGECGRTYARANPRNDLA
jgi:hypothetical protein